MFNEKALLPKLKVEEKMAMAKHQAGSKSRHSRTPAAGSATTDSDLDHSQGVLGRLQRRNAVDSVTTQVRLAFELTERSTNPQRFPGSRSAT